MARPKKETLSNEKLEQKDTESLSNSENTKEKESNITFIKKRDSVENYMTKNKKYMDTEPLSKASNKEAYEINSKNFE